MRCTVSSMSARSRPAPRRRDLARNSGRTALAIRPARSSRCSSGRTAAWRSRKATRSPRSRGRARANRAARRSEGSDWAELSAVRRRRNGIAGARIRREARELRRECARVHHAATELRQPRRARTKPVGARARHAGPRDADLRTRRLHARQGVCQGQGLPSAPLPRGAPVASNAATSPMTLTLPPWRRDREGHPTNDATDSSTGR